MLAKEKKLRSYEHVYVIKKGKRNHHELFTLVYKENGLDTTRCSLTVSKKVAKKAVMRNRIKRKLFSFLHKTYPQFRLGFDTVIIIQKNFLEMDFQKIEEELMEVFKPILK
jgi:ribonuclease P protein component